MGPQGVQGCDFRVKVITKTFGTRKTENRLLHRGPVLSPCRCQYCGGFNSPSRCALSSCATQLLWPSRPWGLRVRKESHLLFLSHPCNALDPDLTCIHTSSSIVNYHQLHAFLYIYSQQVSKAPHLFETRLNPPRELTEHGRFGCWLKTWKAIKEQFQKLESPWKKHHEQRFEIMINLKSIKDHFQKLQNFQKLQKSFI